SIGDVGAYVAPREQARLLEGQRGCSRHRAAAGVVGRQSGQHPQHRRLARSAAADERHDLAPVDPQGDVGEHVAFAVPLVDVAQFTGDLGSALDGGGHARYLNARRSSARTTASVPMPSSAYTINPKMMMSMRRKSRALLIRNPIPLSALICSARISVNHATANDCRTPTSTCGAALGTMMVRNRCQNEKPSTCAVSNSFGSTWRMAEKVFRYSGKLTPSATSSTLGSS